VYGRGAPNGLEENEGKRDRTRQQLYILVVMNGWVTIDTDPRFVTAGSKQQSCYDASCKNPSTNFRSKTWDSMVQNCPINVIAGMSAIALSIIKGLDGLVSG
jgi:hypothetical protein